MRQTYHLKRLDLYGFTLQNSLSLNRRTTLAQLEQVLYSVTWLGESIPHISTIKGHFQTLADEIRKALSLEDRKKRKTDENVLITTDGL